VGSNPTLATMKIIFINSTINREKVNNKYVIPEYLYLMQLCAFTSAKKQTGLPLKLYTDNDGYKFYEKKGILDLFDEIDVDFINNLDNSNLNRSIWTSWKVLPYCNEKPPFIVMDLDFILKSPIPNEIFEYDVVHTHWEILRGDYYITNDMLIDNNINLDIFHQNMLMPNCSFIFFNNQKILNDFKEKHIYLTEIDYFDNTPYWLFLFAEQNLLGYLMRKQNVRNTTIDKRISIQFPDTTSDLGFTPQWAYSDQYENNFTIEYEHVWMKKFFFGDNQETKLKENEWIRMIIENGYEKKLKKII